MAEQKYEVWFLFQFQNNKYKYKYKNEMTAKEN